jgi:hypothetical protein
MSLNNSVKSITTSREDAHMKKYFFPAAAFVAAVLVLSCSTTSITGLGQRKDGNIITGGHISILTPGQIGGAKEVLALLLVNCDTNQSHVVLAGSENRDSGFIGDHFVLANVPPGKYALKEFVLRIGLAGWYGIIDVPIPDTSIIISEAREKIAYLGTYQLIFDSGALYLIKGETRECVYTEYRISQVADNQREAWRTLISTPVIGQISFNHSRTRLYEAPRDFKFLPESRKNEFREKVDGLIEKSGGNEWK